jgi:hypothetical protein
MNSEESKKSLWQLLWDYPNALVVVDPQLRVTIVNPAFCERCTISEPEWCRWAASA